MGSKDMNDEEFFRSARRVERGWRRLKRLAVLSGRAVVAFVCLLGSFGHLFEPDLDYDSVYHFEPTPLGVAWIGMFLVCIRLDRAVRWFLRIWARQLPDSTQPSVFTLVIAGVAVSGLVLVVEQVFTNSIITTIAAGCAVVFFSKIVLVAEYEFLRRFGGDRQELQVPSVAAQVPAVILLELQPGATAMPRRQSFDRSSHRVVPLAPVPRQMVRNGTAYEQD